MIQPIATLLLDADGVTQHNPNFASGMEHLFGDRATLTEILRLEPPSLDGTADLRTVITLFVADKGLDVDPDAVLAVWHETHTLPGVFDLLDEVRRRGVRVYLATNQQPRRGERMIAEKGYELHTDGAFYSYQMGVAKPDPRFFRISSTSSAASRGPPCSSTTSPRTSRPPAPSASRRSSSTATRGRRGCAPSCSATDSSPAEPGGRCGRTARRPPARAQTPDSRRARTNAPARTGGLRAPPDSGRHRTSRIHRRTWAVSMDSGGGRCGPAPPDAEHGARAGHPLRVRADPRGPR